MERIYSWIEIWAILVGLNREYGFIGKIIDGSRFMEGKVGR